MSVIKGDNKGFTAVLALLIAFGLSLVGFTGWFVYQSKQTKDIYNKSGSAYSLAASKSLKPNHTQQPAGPGPTPPPSTPPVTPTPSTNPPDNNGNLTVTDVDNGKTVSLSKNQSLTVQLASTYWTVNESSNTEIIRLSGQPVTAVDKNCIPGGGCGTVTAHFTPGVPGTATITATRTGCGEARTCTGDQGKFQITVITPALR